MRGVGKERAFSFPEYLQTWNPSLPISSEMFLLHRNAAFLLFRNSGIPSKHSRALLPSLKCPVSLPNTITRPPGDLRSHVPSLGLSFLDLDQLTYAKQLPSHPLFPAEHKDPWSTRKDLKGTPELESK